MLERPLGAVFIDHGIPAQPVVRRLDQRKSQIAQRAFVVGEIIAGARRADAGGGLLADPGMNVIGDEYRVEPAEIGGAGAAPGTSAALPRVGDARAATSGEPVQRRLTRRRPPLSAGGWVCGSASAST